MRGDCSPLLVGPGNSVEMTGAPWSWWRRHAARLGLELVRVGTKSFARGADILRAVERHSSAPVELSEPDELAAMRDRIRNAR